MMICYKRQFFVSGAVLLIDYSNIPNQVKDQAAIWLGVDISCYSHIYLLYSETYSCLTFVAIGPYWAICCANTRREVCLGNWCSNSDCLHGYPGLSFVLVQLKMRPLMSLYLSFGFHLTYSGQIIGCSSTDIYSYAEWEGYQKTLDFCWATCLDNSRGNELCSVCLKILITYYVQKSFVDYLNQSS